MSKIIYRIFGSANCESCSKLRKAMNFYGFSFDFVDVNDENNDELCDKYDVETIPHLQALKEDSGEIIVQYIGYISPIAFFNLISEKTVKNNSDLNIKGVAPLYGPNIPKQSKGCNCGETIIVKKDNTQ